MNVPSTLRTWAELDTDALRHNLGVVREKVGPAPGIFAIVKANAYGHTSVPVARALADKVEGFGVATLDEAMELESFGCDLILLSPVLPAERRQVNLKQHIPSVSSAAEALAFPGGRVNLKVDTGMGRIGCEADQVLDEVRQILSSGKVRLHSVSTHLPVPDEDPDATHAQLRSFLALRKALKGQVSPETKFHTLNSAGILGFSEYACDLVRPGLMLYGSAPRTEFQALLRPALAWKTRVLLVRDLPPGRGVSYGRSFITTRQIRCATLAVGYADGFPRQVSGQGAEVLIAGQRCPVLGRVTMDQIVVDVSQAPESQPGDEAVLIGRQGEEEILASTLARQANTIAWHLFTGLGKRVKIIDF